MSISTPLTDLLHIRHPVVLAPMDIVSDATLVRAVGDAGGFGILGGGYGDHEWLSRELERLRDVDIPFGVGFITWSMARDPRLLKTALSRKPRAVMLSFADGTEERERPPP